MSNEMSEKNLTHIIYALYAASVFVGFTSIIAVILNYFKRADVEGSWLESHFTWQIRTFWWSLLWSVIGVISWAVFLGWLVFMVLLIWYLYRILKGWLRLKDGRAMYEP